MKRRMALVLTLVMVLLIVPMAGLPRPVSAAGGPQLDLTLSADTPGSRDVLIGDRNVVAVKFNLTARGDNITINSVRVIFSRLPIQNGVATGDASPAQSNDVANVWLGTEPGTQLTTKKSSDMKSNSVTFGESDWVSPLTIFQNAPKTLNAVFDIPSTCTASGLFASIDGRDVKFTVSSGGQTYQSYANGSAKGTIMAIKESGFINFSSTVETPQSAIVAVGETGLGNITFTKIDIFAGRESIAIRSIPVVSAGPARSFSSVSLYDEGAKVGTDTIGTNIILVNGEAIVNLPADSPWIIPADTHKILTIKVNLNGVTNGAVSGDNLKLGIKTSEVKAVGIVSGKTIPPEQREGNALYGNEMVIQATNELEPSITVLSPNGGEKWERGSTKWEKGNTHKITWASSGINKVRIDYSWGNSPSYFTIASLGTNPGYYDWTIPSDFAISDILKIRVIDSETFTTNDWSDNYFSIVAAPTPVPPAPQQPSITVTSPNGGEKWEIGKTYDITWKATGIDKVMIELSAPNHGWYLTYGTPAEGKFSWKVEGVDPGTSYKISIWDQSASTRVIVAKDESDNYFSIVAPAPPATPLIDWLRAQIATVRAVLENLLAQLKELLASVSLDGPATVTAGQPFSIDVRASGVKGFDAANYTVGFDPKLVRPEAVTEGNIAGTAIPIDLSNQPAPGKWIIIQNIPGLAGVSGTGQLAKLRFRAIGPGIAKITISEGCLADTKAQEIPSDWTGTTINIVPVTTSGIKYDINGDGAVNALDITALERIIVNIKA